MTGTGGQVLLSGGAAANPNYITPAVGTSGNLNIISNAGSLTYDLIANPSVAGALTAAANITTTAGNIVVPNTTGAATGNIVFGAARFISNFGTASNTFVGTGSGNYTNTSQNNTGIGSASMQALGAGGNGNSALGSLALNALTTGAFNVSCGQQSLVSLLTGSRNIAIGIQAASAYTGAESSNIQIGSVGTAGESNVIRIGGGTGTGAGQQNVCQISGITGATVTGAAVLCSTGNLLGTVVSSIRVKDDVQDMGTTSIMKLRPVSFIYKSDSTRSKSYGLIAEEVEEVFKDLVLYEEDGSVHSVKYHEMPAILLNEMQKQQRVIDNLHCRLEQLEAKLNR